MIYIFFQYVVHAQTVKVNAVYIVFIHFLFVFRLKKGVLFQVIY